MSLRTFTVFQDVPSTDSSNAKTATISTIRSPTLASRPLNTNHATTLTTAEKENVHPLTGERAGPSNNNAKKRKTSVLATKVHTPLATKKQKESKEELKESNPEAKKRKSSSTSTAKAKSGVKKDGKSSTSSRKSAKRPSRRVSPMPKVDEEAEAERERVRITQAEIDSRCYELTVQPLADLSQAYEQGASLETPTIEEDKVKFRSVKESSLEPEIRDYFSSPLPQSAALPSGSDAATLALGEGRAFSTPERKQIYAAFTFTSPSPTSERFSKATRANSVPRLELM